MDTALTLARPGTLEWWQPAHLSWEGHVADLRHVLPGYLLLGFDPKTFAAVALKRSAMHAHCWFIGSSGTGKTTTGLIPVVSQLIRGSDEPDGAPAPLLALDLAATKCDLALYNAVRNEALARGQKFYFITTEADFESAVFDPFVSLRGLRYPVPLAAYLAQALELYHGPSYGAGWYSDQNVVGLAVGLEPLMQSGQPLDFQSLCARLELLMRDAKHRDCEHSFSTIWPLTQEPLRSVLHAPPGFAGDSVDMNAVIQNRDVVYLWAPGGGGTHALHVARLALWSFQYAASRLAARGAARRCYCVADEFQEIGGDNVTRLLESSRGAGVSWLLSNQGPNALERNGPGLASTVRTNTSLKVVFATTTKEERELVQELSGEKIEYLEGSSSGESNTESSSWNKTSTEGRAHSRSEQESVSSGLNAGCSVGDSMTVSSGSSAGVARGTGTSSTASVSEADSLGGGTSKATSEGRTLTPVIRPGLTQNELLAVSATPQACVVYTQEHAALVATTGLRDIRPVGGRFMPMQALFSMDVDSYRALLATPMPLRALEPEPPPTKQLNGKRVFAPRVDEAREAVAKNRGLKLASFAKELCAGWPPPQSQSEDSEILELPTVNSGERR